MLDLNIEHVDAAVVVVGFSSQLPDLQEMEAKSGKGRPTNYDGPDSAVLEIFTLHFSAILNHKSKRLGTDEIFIDVNQCKAKGEAVRPYIELMTAMGKLDGNFRFGGPMQTRIVLQWNRNVGFRPTHKSRVWARQEVSKLWNLQRFFEAGAEDDTKWASIVNNTDKYPRPDTWTRETAQAQATMSEEEDDGESAASVAPKSEVEVGSKGTGNTADNIPSWMLKNMAMLGFEASVMMQIWNDTHIGPNLVINNITSLMTRRQASRGPTRST